jgi:hypothetical protein
LSKEEARWIELYTIPLAPFPTPLTEPN